MATLPQSVSPDEVYSECLSKPQSAGVTSFMESQRIGGTDSDAAEPGVHVSTSKSFSPARLRRRQKFARSRDGCFTCKQRKVKCDETRPRCAHCERLNIECKWQGTPWNSMQTRQGSLSSTEATGATRAFALVPSPGLGNSLSLPQHQWPESQAAPQMFDYSSFFWDGTDAWQQVCMNVERDMDEGNQVMEDPFDGTAQANHAELQPQLQEAVFDGAGVATSTTPARSDRSTLAGRETVLLNLSDGQGLIEYFTQSVVPPILSEIEAQKNWVGMRKVLIKMAVESRMVLWALMAFSNTLLCRRNNDWSASQQHHYERATAELSHHQGAEPVAQHSWQRENTFAALFFLSYVDILDGRTEATHLHLQQAYNLFQKGKGERFAPVEKQLLLWIRLLDARAVAAGGEGLFLSKDDEEILVLQTSPASFGGDAEEAGKDDFDDNEVEDIIFQTLYQPGITFFQKVQSFMGRIAKIDPWHRTRGSVQDETEVMGTAATIAADLRALYDQRPGLMDCAVAGKLTTRYMAASLASPLTRAFQTYLSNYYASKIHLHRVAYKTFPLTSEALEAMDHIRRLGKLIAQSLEGEDPLPINMLWPLLLLGTEEQDLNERAWIRGQIIRMEKIAGNARITAQVLDEVQARQDAQRQRVDIGTVMRETFNTRFVVV